MGLYTETETPYINYVRTSTFYRPKKAMVSPLIISLSRRLTRANCIQSE